MSIGNVASFFTDTALLKRPTFTKAVTGATISTYSSQYEIAGCLRPRMDAYLGGERIAADKVTLYATHRFYCAANSSVRQDDELVIGGTTYRVRFVVNVMTMGKLLQVDLREVGHDGN